MQANVQTNEKPYSNIERSNPGEQFYDYIRCMKKYWIQLLLLLILVTAGTVVYLNRSYEPVYTAKVTYSVNEVEDDATINAYLARNLSDAVPVITSIIDFKEELMEQIEQESINKNYEIKSTWTEGANLFSIVVSTNNYKNANIIMEALEKVYPLWASKANGTLSFHIVDRSEATEEPVNPYSLVESVLLGIFFGIVACFCFALWYVYTRSTIRKESDMKTITGKSCISLIPEVNPKKRAKSTKEQLLISKKRIDWGFKQSILAAQSRIEKQMIQNNCKVLLVTSTLPQEGKSMVSVNLALAFAKREEKVLIIDGDLRNPSVGKLLGLSQEQKGLTDFFQNAELDEIITEKEGIDVICGGTQRGDVSGSVSEDEMHKLMIHLREKYDYVIIDTPPAHLFSDAEILEKYADCAVYVVRYDMAEIKEVKDGIAPFVRSDKLLGYVINRNPGGFSTYGKYGYSRYGHYGKYKRYINLDESSLNTEDSL